MKNYDYQPAQLQLFITAVQDLAEVEIKTSGSNFQQTKTLRSGETFTATIPPICELGNNKKGCTSVIVNSSSDVAITALNHKPRTSDTSVIYPTTEWGTDYYVMTPSGKVKNQEFSITNGKVGNEVTIFPGGYLKFKGIFYGKNSKFVVQLKPYESMLFNSNYDLTGTRIVSSEPVAVFTGHVCTTGWSYYCNHFYEQLLPVNKWGSTFIIPTVISQSKYDNVYVQASQPTQIKVTNRDRSYSMTLTAGKAIVLQVFRNKPLYLQANHKIQVLMMFMGIVKGSMYYDAFLTSVLPTDRYCSQYSLRNLRSFDNEALVVVPKTALPKLRLDGKYLYQNGWNIVVGTEYYWRQVDCNGKRIISSSGIPFALYSIGFAQRNGYGSIGQCMQPGKSYAS